jgi:hypothetical protein
MQEMFWLSEPSFARPYTWFLVAVAAVNVVCAGWLSWRLLGGVSRRRIALDSVLDGAVSSNDLAYAALANRIPREALSEERLTQLRSGSRGASDAVLRTLRAADALFDYRWRRLAICVSSTWDLMRLVLVAAAFITAYGFLPTWEYLSLGDSASDAVPARMKELYEAGEYTLARLALGLGVAGGLCAMAMVFDWWLEHRLVSWKRLYAGANDALSAGRSRHASEL